MLKTAISDWGAIPFPTDMTCPMEPFLAILSRLGVFAKLRGVEPFRSGCGRSPIPSSRTYIICTSELSEIFHQLTFRVCCVTHKLYNIFLSDLWKGFKLPDPDCS